MPEPFPVAGKRLYAVTARKYAVLDAFEGGTELDIAPLLLINGIRPVGLGQVTAVVGGGIISVRRPVGIESIPLRIIVVTGKTRIDGQAPVLPDWLGIGRTDADEMRFTERIVMKVKLFIRSARAGKRPFPARAIRVAIRIIGIDLDGAAFIATEALEAAAGAHAEAPALEVRP